VILPIRPEYPSAISKTDGTDTGGTCWIAIPSPSFCRHKSNDRRHRSEDGERAALYDREPVPQNRLLDQRCQTGAEEHGGNQEGQLILGHRDSGTGHGSGNDERDQDRRAEHGQILL
jgi:hypothetical protein